MFNKDICSHMTIYNTYETVQGLEFQPTVLKNVFWQANYTARLATKGIVTDDKISVLILLETDAGGRKYIPSNEWIKAPNKIDFWTITKRDIIMNRIATEDDTDPRKLESVFVVTSFADNRYGSVDMQHFQVIGR